MPEVLQPFMMGMQFIPFKKQFDAKGRLVDRVAAEAAASSSGGGGGGGGGEAAASMSTS